MIFVETEIAAVAGVISIEASTACVTVSVDDPEKPPEKAVIVVKPTLTGVASPLEPDVLLMVATPVAEEFQVTDEDISCVVRSVNEAMAMNCWVVPRPMLGFAGVTVIEVMTAGVTASVDADVMLGKVAKVAAMVVVPSLTAVANPVLLIVATPVIDEDHVATVVKFCGVESTNVPVAVNCWLVPLAMRALIGDKAIEVSGDDLNAAEPELPS